MNLKVASFVFGSVMMLSIFARANSAVQIAVGSDVQTQQRLSYNFGQVFVNTMNRAVFNIRNGGVVPVQREGFSISGPYFDARTDCPVTLMPNQVCQLVINYWPAFAGNHWGQMQMLFTDRNDIIIDLFGSAFR